MWLLLIFVGVAGIGADLDEIAAALEDMTVGCTDADRVEVDRDCDSDLPVQEASLWVSVRLYQQPVFGTPLPTSPARLLSLRL